MLLLRSDVAEMGVGVVARAEAYHCPACAKATACTASLSEV